MKYSFLIDQQNKNAWKDTLSSFLSAPPTSFENFELMFILSEENEEMFVRLVNSFPSYKQLNIKGTVLSSIKEEDSFSRALPLLEGDSVVVIRGNVLNIHTKIWQSFTREHLKGFHIIVSRQERIEALANANKGLIRLTTKMLYGFEPYDGEADIILLDKLALDIMRATPHLSLLFTKLNAWNGLSVSSIEIPKQGRRERASFQPKNLIPFFASFFVFLAVLALHLALAFAVGISIPLHILFIGISVITFALFFYFMLRLVFLIRYGALKERGRASIIRNLYLSGDET